MNAGGMGVPPAASYGAPPGAAPYGAPPPAQPQDFGAQVAQGFNQMGQALNQGIGAAMQPYPGGAIGPTSAPGAMLAGGSQRSWLTTLLLAFFVGYAGVHRFYTGHTLIGVLQLVTCGGFGIWTWIDIVLILMGKYTDAQGRPLLKE